MTQHRDLELLREIPGYKAILKALIKSQIQHLVEQLSSYTEEEAVLLSVSTSDGSLSQLGSECGRGFLDNHEEVKAKFLGFCLKRQHNVPEQAQDEKEPKETSQVEAPAPATPSSLPERSHVARRPRPAPYTITPPTNPNPKKLAQEQPQNPLSLLHQKLMAKSLGGEQGSALQPQAATPTPVCLLQNQAHSNKDNSSSVVVIKTESESSEYAYATSSGIRGSEGNINLSRQNSLQSSLQDDNSLGESVTESYSLNASIDQSGYSIVKAEPGEEELSITGVEFSGAGAMGGGADWQASRDSSYTSDNNEDTDSTRPSLFKEHVTANYIDEVKLASTPANTLKSTLWGISLWNAWRKWRNEAPPSDDVKGSSLYTKAPPLTSGITPQELNYWMCRFILEVRRQDGQTYSAETLRQICTSIWRYLRNLCKRYDLDYFDRAKPEFADIQECLVSTMKKLDRENPPPRRHAKPISTEEEELLWQRVFNKRDSKSLQYAVYFYTCKVFGLRSAEEHTSLYVNQFQFGEDGTGKFVRFLWQQSKTDTDTKDIKQYAANNSERCIVKLFRTYMNLIPTSGPFYRRPLAIKTEDATVRYSHQKVGKHTIQNFLHRMCSEAGIEGEDTDSTHPSRFQERVTANDIDKVKSALTPANTSKSSQWGMNLWNAWRKWRNETPPSDEESTSYTEAPPLNAEITHQELNYWMCRFILEVRKQDGQTYPAESLRQICTSIWRYFRNSCKRYDLNYFDKARPEFADIRECLESTMKKLERENPHLRKQFEPVSKAEEELLWQRVFNKYDSKSLQYAVYFYTCKVFGLRAAEEHTSLDVNQFEFGEDDTGTFVGFVGRKSKTVQKGDTKDIKYYAADNNEHCIVDLFQRYMDLIPTSGPFYRRPLDNKASDGELRYSNQKVGRHSIQKFLPRMCSEAGIEGHKTACDSG